MAYARFVEVGLETGFGAGAAAVAGLLVSSSNDPVDRGVLIEENIDSMIPTGGYGGPLKIAGSLEGNLRPKQMAALFEALLGAKATVGGHDDYTWDLPKSLELRIGETTAGGQLETKYVGVGIKDLEIKAEAKEFCKTTWNYIAKDTEKVTYGEPTYTGETPCIFSGASVTVGGVALTKAKSITIKCDGKLKDDDFLLNSFKIGSIPRDGVVDVSGTIGFSEAELDELNKAIYANTSNTTIPAINTIASVNLNAVFTTVTGAAAMTIEMPTSLYMNTQRRITGRSQIEKQLDYKVVGTGFKVIVYA